VAGLFRVFLEGAFMTLKIYGTAASRAARPLWVAHEMGLAHEHIALPYAGGATRTPEFLAINPNGRIPVVDDEGVLVWESMACVLYLADRFKTPDAPLAGRAKPCRAGRDPALELLGGDRVRERRAGVFDAPHHDAGGSPQAPTGRRRRAPPADAAARAGPAPAGRPYLAGERFTAADICVASVLAWVQGAASLMAQCPRVDEWLQALPVAAGLPHGALMAKSA
jgi:glutathione S-transferase